MLRQKSTTRLVDRTCTGAVHEHTLNSKHTKFDPALCCLQQAQDAVMSRLSYHKLGTHSSWSDSHAPHLDTLNRLVEENNSLRSQIRNGRDYRFYAGILQQFIKDIDSSTGKIDICQKRWNELKQFQASLYSQNPAAFERFTMELHLAAQSRLLDYEAFLRHCDQQRMRDQTQEAGQKSAAEAASLARHLSDLQNSVKTLSQHNETLVSTVHSMKQPLQSFKVCTKHTVSIPCDASQVHSCYCSALAFSEM